MKCPIPGNKDLEVPDAEVIVIGLCTRQGGNAEQVKSESEQQLVRDGSL